MYEHMLEGCFYVCLLGGMIFSAFFVAVFFLPHIGTIDNYFLY